MLSPAFSNTNDMRTYTNTGCIWSFVLTRTYRCFAEDMLDLGSFVLAFHLVKSLANGTNRQYLPEPFLWDTFYHLVETAMAMENGLTDGGGDFEIVHRDIKPANSKSFHTRFKSIESSLTNK